MLTCCYFLRVFFDQPLDRLLYSVLASLSSVVVHHVDGQLTTETLEQFAFLGSKQKKSGTSLLPDYGNGEHL